MLRPGQSHYSNLTSRAVASPGNRVWTLGGPLAGIIVPLVTPLADRNELDIEGLGRLIERVIAGRVDGLFLLGTTGEAASLSPELRRHLVETAVQIIALFRDDVGA